MLDSETQDCCPAEEWVLATFPTAVGCTRSPAAQRRTPLLPASLRAVVAGRLPRTFPILPRGGGEARRVGGGLGDDHEPQSRGAVEPVIQTILTLR